VSAPLSLSLKTFRATTNHVRIALSLAFNPRRSNVALVQRNKILRFNDWHPVGILGGVIFISVATLFNVVIWGLGTQPNISWSARLVLFAIRFGGTAFTLLFFYGGLEMLFGSFSAQIDLTDNVIRYRQRPPPISKRTVIPFETVKSVSIEPRALRRVFAGSSKGFGVFILAEARFFIFETEDQNEALAVASRAAQSLKTSVQNKTPLVTA
jgi:hypothetical protein